MLNNDKYLKLREKRNKYILKSKKSKLKIYSSLAHIIDKKLDKKYKYQIIKVPSNYNIKHQIEDNPQFEIYKDREIKCATRNKFYISDYDEKVNNKFYSLKKHTIVKRFIDNSLLRSLTFFIINIGSIGLSCKINNYFEPTFLYSSLLATLPFRYYASCEYNYSKKHIDNIDKYEVLNKIEELYQTIINNFCLFIYHLKIKNPIDILFIYDATISRICELNEELTDNDIKTTTENIEEIFARGIDTYTTRTLGYNVLLGYGECRNQAILFRDICIRLGLDAKVCALKFIDKEENNNYHAVVLVKYNDSSYILDPEHLANYKYIDNKYISEDNSIKLEVIDELLPKIAFKTMGFDLLSKKLDNINYVTDLTTSYNLLLDDVMVTRINRFNSANENLFIKFNELFNELIDLDDSNKILKK